MSVVLNSGNFALPRETFDNVWTHFGLSQLDRGYLLESNSGWKPEMPLIFYNRQDSHMKRNHPAPNIHSASDENLCPMLQDGMDPSGIQNSTEIAKCNNGSW
jgi:hypothetical protein